MNDARVTSWPALALSAAVVRRAALTTAVVGPILVSINHGDAIVRGAVDVHRALQIALTLIVPYCVSTVSSVAALRSVRSGAAADR